MHTLFIKSILKLCAYLHTKSDHFKMQVTRHILFTIILLFSFSHTHSQNYTSYSGFKDDTILLSRMQKSMQQKFAKDSIEVTGEYKKKIQKFYREQLNFLNDMFVYRLIVTSVSANKYLDDIVNEIVKKNPVLQPLNPRPMLLRDWSPNAFTTGDGTIVFNLGLFTRMNNESQVAFVLCHELAHLYLGHRDKAINQYVNTVYSDDFQKELKKIKKDEYEKNKRLDALEKGIVFTSSRHSRQHESESDSMALVFMSNTFFDTHQSLTALALLDIIDENALEMENILKKHFSFPDFLFKENWLKKEQGFFGGSSKSEVDKKMADSLKTHPDCISRIKSLTPAVDKISVQNKLFPISETSFKQQQDTLKYEMIELLWRKEYISRALFEALQLLESRPGDIYLMGTVGACLNKIYTYQKEHRLGKIIDNPSPYIKKDYNTLLKFIEALRLDEIAGIAYHFLNNNARPLNTNERFEKALKDSKENFK